RIPQSVLQFDVERVHRVRSVERDGGDVVGDVIEQDVRHAFLLATLSLARRRSDSSPCPCGGLLMSEPYKSLKNAQPSRMGSARPVATGHEARVDKPDRAGEKAPGLAVKEGSGLVARPVARQQDPGEARVAEEELPPLVQQPAADGERHLVARSHSA